MAVSEGGSFGSSSSLGSASLNREVSDVKRVTLTILSGVKCRGESRSGSGRRRRAPVPTRAKRMALAPRRIILPREFGSGAVDDGVERLLERERVAEGREEVRRTRRARGEAVEGFAELKRAQRRHVGVSMSPCSRAVLLPDRAARRGRARAGWLRFFVSSSPKNGRPLPGCCHCCARAVTY